MRWLMALLLCAAPAAAQQQPTAPPPAADPADVASVDAIITALYDVISGPAGQKRDWDRFRSLFLPGARLIPTTKRPDGTVVHRVLTPEQYVEMSGRILEERGFFEREIGRATDQFGSITHVFSAYDSRHRAEDPTPFARGINSIQLLDDGARWWVVSIFWDGERAGQEIPAKYLRR